MEKDVSLSQFLRISKVLRILRDYTSDSNKNWGRYSPFRLIWQSDRAKFLVGRKVCGSRKLARMYRKIQHLGIEQKQSRKSSTKVKCKIWLYAGITLYPTVL